MVRMGLVLHPYRDSSAAVAQVAAWTGTRDVQLVADRSDVARLGLAGVTGVPTEELAGTCDGIIARRDRSGGARHSKSSQKTTVRYP